MADKKGKKPAEKTEIKLAMGTCTADEDNFKIVIEARVIKGTKVLAGVKVRFKKGIKALTTKTTDANGEVLYEHVEPKSMSGKDLLLSVLLEGGDAAGAEAKITLPTLMDEEEKGVNPETMTLRSHHDGNGGFTVFIRVLNPGGIGVEAPVVIECDGRQVTATTDEDGNGSWVLPRQLDYREKIEVVGKVSGIKDSAILKLRRPRRRNPVESRFSFSWLFGKNNGRAILFLLMSVLFWGLCWSIGWGNSVIVKPVKELSHEQKLYNQIVGATEAVKIEDTASRYAEDKGEWQKYIWLAALIWTLFALIYAPFSLREEIAEGVQEAIQKIAEKRNTRTSDPFYEKMAAFSNSYASTRRLGSKGNTSGGSDDSKGKVKTMKDGTPFSKLLASDLISDVLVEVVPSLFSSIFRK